MKICSRCQQALPLEKFNRRGEGYQSNCRECNKAYYKNYYKNNPKEKERIRSNTKRLRLEIRNFLNDVKTVPCTDCNIQYPSYVMQFDHLDNKEFTISHSMNTKTLTQIKLEIAKCEVVCANCHAERTYQRRLASGD